MTPGEYHRVMQRKLIIKEFGPNIQHISGFDNIVAYTISRLPSTPSDKYETCTRKTQCRANDLFAIGRVENNEYIFPAKYLNCKNITTKGTEKYKFQNQYIHFGSRI